LPKFDEEHDITVDTGPFEMLHIAEIIEPCDSEPEDSPEEKKGGEEKPKESPEKEKKSGAEIIKTVNMAHRSNLSQDSSIKRKEGD